MLTEHELQNESIGRQDPGQACFLQRMLVFCRIEFISADTLKCFQVVSQIISGLAGRLHIFLSLAQSNGRDQKAVSLNRDLLGSVGPEFLVGNFKDEISRLSLQHYHCTAHAPDAPAFVKCVVAGSSNLK